MKKKKSKKRERAFVRLKMELSPPSFWISADDRRFVGTVSEQQTNALNRSLPVVEPSKKSTTQKNLRAPSDAICQVSSRDNIKCQPFVVHHVPLRHSNIVISPNGIVPGTLRK